jgi:hypothetical protein
MSVVIILLINYVLFSKWGLQNIIDDETMTQKEAMKRFRKCREPGAPPITPIPDKKSERQEFDDYNEEALELFHDHANNCIWCRTTNKAAMDALRKAEEEEAARRRAEEEAARRRVAEVCTPSLMHNYPPISDTDTDTHTHTHTHTFIAAFVHVSLSLLFIYPPGGGSK